VIFKVNQSVFKLFVLCSRLLDLSLSLCGFFFFFLKKKWFLIKTRGILERVVTKEMVIDWLADSGLWLTLYVISGMWLYSLKMEIIELKTINSRTCNLYLKVSALGIKFQDKNIFIFNFLIKNPKRIWFFYDKRTGKKKYFCC